MDREGGVGGRPRTQGAGRVRLGRAWGGLGQAAGAWALLESWAGAGMPPQPWCLGWGSEAGGPREGREERKTEGVPSS